MAEAKKASLTVLGGPLAGTRTLLPDDAEVTIGSSEECALCLEQPSVSAVHARLVTQGGQITVFATGAERPLHVNDSPVAGGGLPLRNGDILWLGTPGEDDVVMLQCILPRRPAASASPEPPEVAPAPPTPDIETTALWTGAEETQSLGDQPTASFAPGDDVESGYADTTDESTVVEAPGTGESPVPGDEPLMLTFGEDGSGPGAEDENEAVVVEEPPPGETEFAPVDVDDASAVVVEEGELSSESAPTFVGAPFDAVGATPTFIGGPEDFETPVVEATGAIEPEDDGVPMVEPIPLAPPPPPAAPAPPSPPSPPAAARPSPPAGPSPDRPVSRPGASATPPSPSRRPPREGAASPRPLPPPSASMARRRPAPRREAPGAAPPELEGAAPSRGGRPALLVVGAVVTLLGTRPVALILVAQVLNGFILPIVALVLLLAMNDRRRLGDNVNGWRANLAGGLVVLLCLALGMRGLVGAVAGR